MTDNTPAHYQAQTPAGIPGAEWLTPANMDQGMRLAEMMAKSALVPDHLKGKPEDCFPILVQSLRWRMDPFAVSQVTSVVRGKLCYEGKLVHAVLISMRAIHGRLTFEYDGQGPARRVTVTGTPSGDKPRSISGTVSQWKTSNENWTKDPDMMLAYRGTRAWARLYCPDAMLGVYTPDEIEESEPREVVGAVVNAADLEPVPAKPKRARATVDAPAAAPTPEPEPVAEQEQDEPPAITRADVQDLLSSHWKVDRPACLLILGRADAAKLSDVPDDKLERVAKELRDAINAAKKAGEEGGEA